MNNVIKARVSKGINNETRNSNILSTIRDNPQLLIDAKEKAIRQYMSYHFIRLGAEAFARCGIDIYTISNNFFKELDIMYFLTKDREYCLVLADIIYAELGKIINMVCLRNPEININAETIRSEIEELVFSCKSVLK